MIIGIEETCKQIPKEPYRSLADMVSLVLVKKIHESSKISKKFIHIQTEHPHECIFS